MSRDTLKKLDEMLKAANLTMCLCFACKHDSEYGTCEECGCKNDARLSPKEKERDND